MQITEAEYKKQFDEEDAVGWDCIDSKLNKLYNGIEPRHYPSIVKFMIGGTDPIDGTSIYDATSPIPHHHIVSYGMSDLYHNPESAGSEFSGWGFEFSFRVVTRVDDKNNNGTEDDPFWVISLMNNLARYVFESKKWFEPYHFMPANGPIHLETDTEIVGIVFVLDPELGEMDTPHGQVQFLQIVGITQQEIDWIMETPNTERVEVLVEKMRIDNPMLITDLARKKSYL